MSLLVPSFILMCRDPVCRYVYLIPATITARPIIVVVAIVVIVIAVATTYG